MAPSPPLSRSLSSSRAWNTVSLTRASAAQTEQRRTRPTATARPPKEPRGAIDSDRHVAPPVLVAGPGFAAGGAAGAGAFAVACAGTEAEVTDAVPLMFAFC